MNLEKEAANLFGRGMKAECLRKIEQMMEIMKKNWDEFSLQVRSLKKLLTACYAHCSDASGLQPL